MTTTTFRAPHSDREPFIVRRRAEIGLRDLACKAICRIKKGLRQPGVQSDGRPFVPQDWDQLFKPHLGSYIKFLLSRPDQFRVLEGAGPGRYTVEDVTRDETVLAPSPEELAAAKGGKGGFKGKGKGKAGKAADPKGRKGAYKGVRAELVGKGQKAKQGSSVLMAKGKGKTPASHAITGVTTRGGKGKRPVLASADRQGAETPLGKAAGKRKAAGQLASHWHQPEASQPSVEDDLDMVEVSVEVELEAEATEALEHAFQDDVKEEEEPEVLVPKKRGFLISTLLGGTKRRLASEPDDATQW